MSNLDLFKAFAAKDNSVKVSGTSAVIYTRVSHVSQKDNTSLESQLKYCQEHAKRKGLNVVNYFGGTHESAKTDERLEFKKMLKFIKQSKNVSYIIVYSYERFSRTGIGGAKIADDLLKDYGIVTLSVTQELDPTTSSGSFQQNILFLFGQMDNELRRSKTITGMAEIMRLGYTPRRPPLGYTNLVKGKAVNQKIVVNEEGKLLRKAFHWKIMGLSNTNITRKLNALGLKIDKRRLNYIFSNPYYCGLIVNSMIPGEVIEGKHEVLISREIFLRVNNIVVKNKNVTHPLTHRDTDEHLPLKVFAKCSGCKTNMTGYIVKAKGLYYYKCRTTGCQNNVSAKKTHQKFVKLLSAFKIDEQDAPLIATAVESYYESILEESKQVNALEKRRVSEINSKIEKLEERFAIGEIGKDLYEKFVTKYTEQIKEIAPNQSETQVNSSNLRKCLDYAIEICLNPLVLWESSDIHGKIKLQKLIFPDGIVINQQNKGVRTNRIDSLFAPIAELAAIVKGQKKGQPINYDQLSALVTPEGF